MAPDDGAARVTQSNESLPEVVPVCPQCGSGGHNLPFGKKATVVIIDEFIPEVDEFGDVVCDDRIIHNYDIEWDTYSPVQKFYPNEKKYICLLCGAEFNEFKLVGREEFAWHQMLEAKV